MLFPNSKVIIVVIIINKTNIVRAGIYIKWSVIILNKDSNIKISKTVERKITVLFKYFMVLFLFLIFSIKLICADDNDSIIRLSKKFLLILSDESHKTIQKSINSQAINVVKKYPILHSIKLVVENILYSFFSWSVNIQVYMMLKIKVVPIDFIVFNTMSVKPWFKMFIINISIFRRIAIEIILVILFFIYYI